MKTILVLLAAVTIVITASANAQFGGAYSPDYEYNMQQRYGRNWRQVFLAAQIATAPNTGPQVVVVNPNNGWGNNNCYPYQQPVYWGGNVNCGFRPQPMPRPYVPRIRCGW